MRRSLTFVALVLGFGLANQASAEPCDGIDFDQVIFREDFTGPDGSLPDDDWAIGHPGWCWFVLGRTFIPTPNCLPGAPPEDFPHLQNNTCVITHYNYNQYHLNPPKTTFLGGELHTKMPFEPTRPYRFEAKVRWPQAPRGLVASFFTYGYDDVHQDSDEIDFEFLSNEVFTPPDHRVLTNTWDDSDEDPAQVAIPEMDLTQWQTFRIYWDPDVCVKWTWINPTTGQEVVLRTVTDPARIPDEPMGVYFNFWAPDAGWSEAHDGGLQPDQVDNGVKYEYFVDYLEVRVPEPTACMFLAVAAVWVLPGRRRPPSAH